MPLVFLLSVIVSYILTQLYWTSHSFILILGLLGLFGDAVAQGILTIIDRTFLPKLLSAMTLFLLGMVYLFIWTFWPGHPGEQIMSLIVLLAAFGYFWYWWKKKLKRNPRFWMNGLFFLVILIGSQLKNSTILCLKYNMDAEQPVAPISLKHRLAWAYYKENSHQRAGRFLMEEEQYLVRQLQSSRLDRKQKPAYEQDLEKVRAALKEFRSGHWTNYNSLRSEPLFLFYE